MGSTKTEATLSLPVVDKSRVLFEEACRFLPGGPQLLSRRPSRFAEGVAPIFAERAEGARFWDIDGNEFIDTTMSVGACLLGYADPDVDGAVRAQIERGTIFSVLHPVEVELAKLLVDTIPCAEMARFGKSGGEADAVAVRIARGFTGRDRVAFCGYHGWHDWYLAANLDVPDNLDEHLLPGVPAAGVPRALAGTSIPFKYGDIDALRTVLERYPGEFACVIMEASRYALPPEGYLAAVKDLAHTHRALLIFDEVVTGFRLAPGGAQEYYGVTPDMATFGKAIGNGYPLTAIVGRRDIMEASANMFISSMYWDDNSTLAAGVAAVTKIKGNRVTEHIHRMGTRYQEAWTALAHKSGVRAHLKGLPPGTSIGFDYEDEEQSKLLNTLYCQEMVRRGVFGGIQFNVSYAHGDAEIDAILEAAEGALFVLKRALDGGDLSGYLKAQPQEPLFRRRMV